jgi:2-oxoglutarate ferredoxin oxidoreductase subunit alpha
MAMITEQASRPRQARTEERQSVVVRFAGDSGDGMQLAGSQFTSTSAMFGNDVSTFPDYPAEIRAPAGTLAGVSGFQVHFSSQDIMTPGDQLDALVAMNPAALKTNLSSLSKGGTLIVNTDAFTGNELKKAGYPQNPLEDGSLSGFQVVKVPMTTLNREAVGESSLGTRKVDLCRNFFALGLVYWMYERPLEPTLRWIREKFAKQPAVLDANVKALNAGYHLGETLELIGPRIRVQPVKSVRPGVYRHIMGNQALAYGLVTAATLAGKELFYASYPITPASDILHELSRLKNLRVKTFQAEDEIAAITAAIGAAYGGAFAATATSGPGMALKGEAIGLAVMVELPLVIVNVQRGGPSTGLPTKTEQADLFQAVLGRNGECPLPVIACAHPSDCFDAAQDAFRIAVEFMTPVILLSDGSIANGAEPWRIPDMLENKPIRVQHVKAPNGDGENPFFPYERNDRLARPWAIPGTPGCEHRIGGLEKQNITGNVSYDAENHQLMVQLRQQKVDKVADFVPEQMVEGPQSGELLVVSWGGTFGAVSTAVAKAQAAGKSVAHAHLRYVNPFPRNLGSIIKRFRKVLVPELNLGQLLLLLRGRFLVDAAGYNKVKGQPFGVDELVAAIDRMLPE